MGEVEMIVIIIHTGLLKTLSINGQVWLTTRQKLVIILYMVSVLIVG